MNSEILVYVLGVLGVVVTGVLIYFNRAKSSDSSTTKEPSNSGFEGKALDALESKNAESKTTEPKTTEPKTTEPKTVEQKATEQTKVQEIQQTQKQAVQAFNFRADEMNIEQSTERTEVKSVQQSELQKPKKIFNQTEEQIFGRIKKLFSTSSNQTSHLDEIEEILYTSDLGPSTVQKLMNSLEDLSKSERTDIEKIKSTLKLEILNIFKSSVTMNEGVDTPEQSKAGEEKSIERQRVDVTGELIQKNSIPTVLMIVGVNGAGKTTTIGKISSQLAQSGKKILVAAGDTFRAAAGSQLQVWTDRAQVEIFSPEGVTDPSAVAFDAVSKAKAKNYDVVIIDTAGRLHVHQHLMEELKKMKKVISKVIPEAPHEILIVLDANSGQNALLQAKEFHQALGLTGVILTKMDGTAKGGVAVGISYELKIPIKLIGVGEKISDLKKFSHQEFVDAIFS